MSLNAKGGSKVSVLLFIMVATVAIYIAIKIVPPYQEYYAMEDEVSTQLRMSTINSDEVILDDLYAKAQELELPVAKEDISLVHEEDGSIMFSMAWVREVDFRYGIKREFPFSIDFTTKAKNKE